MYKLVCVVCLTVAAMLCGAVASTVYARLDLAFSADNPLEVNRLVKSDRLFRIPIAVNVERSRKMDRLQIVVASLPPARSAKPSTRHIVPTKYTDPDGVVAFVIPQDVRITPAGGKGGKLTNLAPQPIEPER